MSTPDTLSLEDSNHQLLPLAAEDRIKWALEYYPNQTVLSTSFGIQSSVMLHMATQVKPDIPVIFVDTGYLFPETYKYAEELTERSNLNLHIYNPKMTAARQEAIYGKLWEQGYEGLTQYGMINKVEPMDRALKELGARVWVTGLRRQQSSTRSELEVIAQQKQTYKFHPIIEWTNKDVYYYQQQHGLPVHPLWEQGYVTVGDVHSTKPLTEGMTEEETRFNGIKRECGLHEVTITGDFQI